MSDPLDPSHKLIREWDDSDHKGAWVGKATYVDNSGGEYTICCDQDGGEWIEE